MKLMYLSCAIVMLFLLSCAPPEKQCAADSDCVPAQCCHASDAVNKEYGPNCSGRLCTLQCEPGTIDCGQGEIKCVSGQCQAVVTP